MSIVSSSFSVGHAQVDGRHYVVETHTDHLGVLHLREYLADVTADCAAIAADYAVRLAVTLAEAEFEDRLGNVITPIAPQHQTIVQFAARLRARFLGSEREDTARIATWILAKLDGGQITSTQIRSVFGLTVPQYAALEARLVILRDHWAAVSIARGE